MRRAQLKPGRGFKSKLPPPKPARQMDYTPRPRAFERTGPARAVDPPRPMPKAHAIQHEAYMAAVRKLACAHCGKPGPSQFCHSDLGKGERIKSDCREGWPGCADSPLALGCHSLIGTQRIYPKEQRRELEAAMAAATRAEIRSRGLWPASLPHWPADNMQPDQELQPA